MAKQALQWTAQGRREGKHLEKRLGEKLCLQLVSNKANGRFTPLEYGIPLERSLKLLCKSKHFPRRHEGGSTGQSWVEISGLWSMFTPGA